MKKKNCTTEVSVTKTSVKRGRPRKVGLHPVEIATEQCFKWLSTLGISATTTPRASIGCLNCVDLCRKSSGNEERRKSGRLLIRLVSEECTKTSRRGCKGCLKVLVYVPTSPSRLEGLWQMLKSLTSSSLKGWNLSFAPLMPTPLRG